MRQTLVLHAGKSIRRQVLWRLLTFRLPMVIEVRPEVMLPPFYGWAWVEWDQNVNIAVILPFNLIYAFYRWAWSWLRGGCALWFWKHRNRKAEKGTPCSRS